MDDFLFSIFLLLPKRLQSCSLFADAPALLERWIFYLPPLRILLFASICSQKRVKILPNIICFPIPLKASAPNRFLHLFSNRARITLLTTRTRSHPTTRVTRQTTSIRKISHASLREPRSAGDKNVNRQASAGQRIESSAIHSWSNQLPVRIDHSPSPCARTPRQASARGSTVQSIRRIWQQQSAIPCAKLSTYLVGHESRSRCRDESIRSISIGRTSPGDETHLSDLSIPKRFVVARERPRPDREFRALVFPRLPSENRDAGARSCENRFLTRSTAG